MTTTLSSRQECDRFDKLFTSAVDRLRNEIEMYNERGYEIHQYVDSEDIDTLVEVFTLYRTSNAVGVNSALSSHADLVAMISFVESRLRQAQQRADSDLKTKAATLAIVTRIDFMGTVRRMYDTLVERGEVEKAKTIRFDVVKQTDASVKSLVDWSDEYRVADAIHGLTAQLSNLAQSLLHRIEQRRDCLVQLSIHDRERRT